MFRPLKLKKKDRLGQSEGIPTNVSSTHTKIYDEITSRFALSLVPRSAHGSMQLFSEVVSRLPTHMNIFFFESYTLHAGLQSYTIEFTIVCHTFT